MLFAYHPPSYFCKLSQKNMICKFNSVATPYNLEKEREQSYGVDFAMPGYVD